jgi:ankyrin repeat protein
MGRMLSVAVVAFLTGALALQAGDKLSRAAVDGDLNKAKECVAKGEKVGDIDKWGWTALHWAAYYGQPGVVSWLLEQGADPNIPTQKKYGNFVPGATPLTLAAYYGQDKIVADLLAHKADASMKDGSGNTALEYAERFNFDACAKLLKKP